MSAASGMTIAISNHDAGGTTTNTKAFADPAGFFTSSP